MWKLIVWGKVNRHFLELGSMGFCTERSRLGFSIRVILQLELLSKLGLLNQSVSFVVLEGFLFSFNFYSYVSIVQSDRFQNDIFIQVYYVIQPYSFFISLSCPFLTLLQKCLIYFHVTYTMILYRQYKSQAKNIRENMQYRSFCVWLILDKKMLRVWVQKYTIFRIPPK